MISLLLGSGFSVEEGIPGVGKINEVLSTLKADQIYFGSDLTAFLLKHGVKDPNAWSSVLERTFVEELIQFYIQQIIEDRSKFNYESFFDYYYFPYRSNSYPPELETFLDNFRHRRGKKDRLVYNNINLLNKFHIIFSQLVAQLLNLPKYYEDISLGSYPKYGNFIKFLTHCSSSCDIKVHSLNHDLFFEHLGLRHQDLFDYYCDGYTDLGSPYYGEVSPKNQEIIKTYKVRLKFFNGRFENKLCFYKLHGSVDTYVFNLASPNPDYTRIKRDWLVGEIFKEIKNDKTGALELEYTQGFQNNYPDFLSGTTAKVLSYENDYYKILFDHFKSNLNNSELFVVVGYGFKDGEINRMIEDNFLKKGKKMIVIDPFPNKNAFTTNYNIIYIEKGVTDVTENEWLSIC